MITSTHWGVLVAQHSQLVVGIGATLTSMSIDNYIPLTEKVQVINRRHVMKTTPILGEYVFFSVCKLWPKIFRLKGVAGILLNDLGYPAQVLPRELQLLRDFYGLGIYKEELPAITGFKYGDQVMVKEGPFAYHVARYEGKTRKGADTAILTLFGREQKVVFKRGALAPV